MGQMCCCSKERKPEVDKSIDYEKERRSVAVMLIDPDTYTSTLSLRSLKFPVPSKYLIDIITLV